MVPGMTERERRASDLRRVDWLADAYLGPSRLVADGPRTPAPPAGQVPVSLANLWRRGLAAARVLGARIRALPDGKSLSGGEPAPIR
jgi:hypothetical protein